MLEKVEYVLVKIHKGSIVDMLMNKQWPNKPYPKDTTSLPCREILRNTSKKCEKCQMFTPISRTIKAHNVSHTLVIFLKRT